jgi:hypothetical protein
MVEEGMNNILTLLMLISLPISAAEKLLKVERFVDSIAADPQISSFELRVQHKENTYSFSEGKPYYLSKMVAKIATKKSEYLKEYGIVQFIRGCLFTTTKNNDGTINYSYDSTRYFFGDIVPMIHPEWVIDSADTDPLYWSSDKNRRLANYRLDDPMLHQEPKNRKYYDTHFTNQKAFFIRDMPTGATEFDDGHQNSSMQFKTCLYKLSDVPLTIAPSGEAIVGKELKCFEWQNNFIFNYEKNKYQMAKDIHPACLPSL